MPGKTRLFHLLLPAIAVSWVGGWAGGWVGWEREESLSTSLPTCCGGGSPHIRVTRHKQFLERQAEEPPPHPEEEEEVEEELDGGEEEEAGGGCEDFPQLALCAGYGEEEVH